MNRTKKFLVQAAGYFDLPADILAGIPKMELIGFQEFSIEPHHGLLEYEQEQISIETDLGKIRIEGSELTIKLMNRHRITVQGILCAVHLQESDCE